MFSEAAAAAAAARIASLEKVNAMLCEELNELKSASMMGGSGGFHSHDGNHEDCNLRPGFSDMIFKVNHVSLVCSDVKASEEFYIKKIGARILNRPNFPFPGAWLWLGNVQLHLIEGSNACMEAMHAEGCAMGHVNHISLEVTDFAAVEKQLSELDVKFTKNLVPVGEGVIHQLFLEDPDGHYLEICDCNRFADFIFGDKPDPARS